MDRNLLKNNSLNIIETVAMSAAIMAPSASMALNVPLITSASGYSVTLVFIIAIIIIGFVSLSVIKFNQLFPNSGSLYAFTKKALGRKAGFITGWSLFLTYFMFTIGCSAAFGSYISKFLAMINLNVNWLLISILFSGLTWILAYRDIKLSTQVMLIMEVISILLIFVLSLVILIKTGLNGGLSMAPLKTDGADFSTIAKGSVLGLLCFAGFEGTSTLGEEAKNAKRSIPIVIGGTIIFIGVFFLITSYAQVIGFGANNSGIKALSNSSSPLSDLSSRFISGFYAQLLTLGVSLSLFSCTIGTACAGARILYSISRDGEIPQQLSKVHLKYRTPHVAVSALMIVSIAVQVIFIKAQGTDLYNYTATIASLAVLVAYILTNVAAMVFFTKRNMWEKKNLIAPAIGIIALCFTIYSNLYPVPIFPYNVLPYLVLGWIVLGLIMVYINGKRSKELPSSIKS